jgi:hypothetical protein
VRERRGRSGVKTREMKEESNRTDRAQAVMNRLKLIGLFQKPKTRDKVLDDFNRSTLDAAGPVGGEEGTRVLQDMNDLEAGHDEFLKSLAKSYSVAGNHWQTYK